MVYATSENPVELREMLLTNYIFINKFIVVNDSNDGRVVFSQHVGPLRTTPMELNGPSPTCCVVFHQPNPINFLSKTNRIKSGRTAFSVSL